MDFTEYLLGRGFGQAGYTPPTNTNPSVSAELPPGFVPDQPEDNSPAAPQIGSPGLPPGFVEDNPEGTGVGRAVDRGLLTMQQFLPGLETAKVSSVLQDMALPEQDLIRDLFLQTSSLPDVPEGMDISTPEKASAALAGMGYPPQMVNDFRQIYDIRKADADKALGLEPEQRSLSIYDLPEGRQALVDEGVGAMQTVADLERQKAELPNSPGAANFANEFAETEDGFLPALATILSDPLGSTAFLGETVAEQLPTMLGAGAATLATRSPSLGAAVLGGGGFAQEYPGRVSEFMADRGISVSTPEEAAALLQNPELMGEAHATGVGQAVTVALMEMAGQGVAGKIGTSATGKAVADVGTQAATGAAGEGAAAMVAGKTPSAKDMLIEALAEAVGAPVEVGPAMIEDARARKAAGAEMALPAVEGTPDLPPGFVPDETSSAPTDAAAPVQTQAPVLPATDPVAVAPQPDQPPVEPTGEAPVDPGVAPLPPAAPVEPAPLAAPDAEPVTGAAPVETPVEPTLDTPALEPTPAASPEELDARYQAAADTFAKTRTNYNLGMATEDDVNAAKLARDEAFVARDNALRAQPAPAPAAAPDPAPAAVAAPVTPTEAPAPVSAAPTGQPTEGVKPTFAPPSADPDENVKRLGAIRSSIPGQHQSLPRQRAEAMAARADEVDALVQSATASGVPLSVNEAQFVREVKEARANHTVAQTVQQSLDSFVADLQTRGAERTRANGGQAHDNFNRDMDEIAAYADSLRRQYGVTPDFMPTVNYTLTRASGGKTKYRVPMTPAAGNAGEKGVSQFETWRKEMSKGRRGMNPATMLATGSGTKPSVGPAQRFSEEADADATPGQDAADVDPDEFLDVDAMTDEDLNALDADEDDEGGTPATFQSRKVGSTPENPDFNDVSKMDEASASVFEQAWRDAGLTPDEGTLLPPVQKINVLSRLMGDKFKFKIERGGRVKSKAVDAVDAMLDAYRNVQFMAHALQLPQEAISLHGTLTVSLDRPNARYLGMYDPNSRTIHMPGRTNSFAHEWGHALDHFLRSKLAPKAENSLLSQAVRDGGIDRAGDLSEAFVHLLYTMLFDQVKLGASMLTLETLAMKTDKNGQPLSSADKARDQLIKLAEGNTQLRLAPSAYKENAALFSPGASGYFASVHEMFARAFEAYVGFKMDLAGAGKGPNAFVSKGDAAYLSDADRRLAMTFPKATERLAIFDAFDQVFHHMRVQSVIGDGPAAAKPADTDILDPMHWRKLDLDQRIASGDGVLSELKQEYNSAKNLLTRLMQSPVATLKGGTSNMAMQAGLASKADAKDWGQKLWDMAKFLIGTQRGFAKSIIARQPKDARLFLESLMGGVMTDPGTGQKFQPENVEERAERSATRVATEIQSLLRANGLRNGWLKGLSKADNLTIRELMFDGKSVASATADQKAVAAGLRRIMDKTYREAVAAGLDLGYVENQGYLPRIIRQDQADQRPGEFVKKASEVYEIHMDNETAGMSVDEVLDFANMVARRVNPMDGAKDPRFAGPIKTLRQAKGKPNEASAREALLDLLKPHYAETSARAWLERILIGTGLTFDTVGPAADFKAKRGLPKEAEKIMGDFYEQDALFTVLDYTHSMAKRTAYQNAFGKETKASDQIESMLSRKNVADRVRGNPGRYSLTTPTGRLAIIRELADPAQDNVKEMLTHEALRHGADPEAIKDMRRIIENITGRGSHVGSAPHLERFTSGVYVLGTLMLLPRSAWSSLAEPLGFMLRTGDVKNTARTMGLYFREAIRGAKSVKELSALAEAVGVVSTPLHDAVMLNRVAEGTSYGSAGNVITSRFFRANLQSQLTNAQRRVALAGGSYFLRDMARMADGLDATRRSDRVRMKMIRAELSDLGVARENQDGFLAWLRAGEGLPSLDDLKTPEGEVFMAAAARLTDQIITNPHRADKPYYAISPYGRLIYGLMSFIYTFFRNMHLAIANRTKAEYDAWRDEGAGRIEAGAMAAFHQTPRFFAGFATIMMGQMIVSYFREMLFSSEQFEEKEEEGELYDWLAGLAFSRSGIMGPADVLIQSMTGLRYERDLTTLTAGAHLGFILSQVQNIAKAFGDRNSPNTNTAEHTAAKSVYRLTLAPFAATLLSLAPGSGPAMTAVKTGGLFFSTSNSAASGFADMAVGPKSKAQ